MAPAMTVQYCPALDQTRSENHTQKHSRKHPGRAALVHLRLDHTLVFGEKRDTTRPSTSLVLAYEFPLGASPPKVHDVAMYNYELKKFRNWRTGMWLQFSV